MEDEGSTAVVRVGNLDTVLRPIRRIMPSLSIDFAGFQRIEPSGEAEQVAAAGKTRRDLKLRCMFHLREVRYEVRDAWRWPCIGVLRRTRTGWRGNGPATYSIFKGHFRYDPTCSYVTALGNLSHVVHRRGHRSPLEHLGPPLLS